MAHRILSSALLLPALLGAQEPEVRTTARDRRALAVTVYADGRALVQDKRRVTLPKGACSVAFEEVSDQIEPASAMFATNDGSTLDVRQQRFAFDLLTPSRLIERSLGSGVKVRLEGGEPGESGRLRSLPESASSPGFRVFPGTNRPGVDARKASLEAFHSRDRIVVETRQGFSSHGVSDVMPTHLPPDIRARPTLIQDLHAKAEGRHEVDLSYLTTGLTWQATYRAVLSVDARRMDLTAFVTLRNDTDTSFDDAKLQLVAGETNRAVVNDSPVPWSGSAVVCVVASAPIFKAEPLSEYMLWTLGRPTRLGARQEKQLLLFHVEGIPVTVKHRLDVFLEEYPLREWHRTDPSTLTCRFENDRGGVLGRPLPQGEVFLSQGARLISVPLSLQGSGPEMGLPGEPVVIENTPVGESVDWSIGPDPNLQVRTRLLESREESVGHVLRRKFAQGLWRTTSSSRMLAQEEEAKNDQRRQRTQLTYEIEIQNMCSKPQQPDLFIGMPEEWLLLSCTERVLGRDPWTIRLAPRLAAGGTWSIRCTVSRP